MEKMSKKHEITFDNSNIKAAARDQKTGSIGTRSIGIHSIGPGLPENGTSVNLNIRPFLQSLPLLRQFPLPYSLQALLPLNITLCRLFPSTNSIADLFLRTDDFLTISRRQTLEPAHLFFLEATHRRLFPGEDGVDVLGLLADVGRLEAVKLAAFLELDAVDRRDFPVADGVEGGGVIASTVAEGRGEMYLRDWSLGLKALEFRVGFDVLYLWVDGRNGVCAGPGCVEITRHFVRFRLLAKLTSTRNFGVGSKEAVSDCPRDWKETSDG